MESTRTIEGIVTDFRWRNPHVYFNVDVIDDDGNVVEWNVQMGAIVPVERMGWDRDTLEPGDRVVVDLRPAVSGRPYGILEAIDRNGVELTTSFPEGSSEAVLPVPDGTLRAESIEGVWIADGSKFAAYPGGGMDNYFLANLVLTDAGRAARASFDPLSVESPESRCIARPAPGMLMAAHFFPIQIEIAEAENIVYLRSEMWDEVRSVYMDGRDHPNIDERTNGGHSIGRWDGDTLVVDTRNFSDHRSPYQIGVPSGAQKHLIERYRLNEDRTHLIVEYTLADPQYLAEPLVDSLELIYAPEMRIGRFDCDPEASDAFLPER